MGFFEILILIPMVLISLVLLAIPVAILILMFRTYDKVKKIEDTLSKEQD
jgi:predicted membrane protein